MRRLTERYSVGDRIGRGGVGVVFRGWQTALDRPVAIKILRPELTRHSAVVARFEREALTTCRLHHPNVVTVFDVGIAEDGTRFLVMELLEGETLAARLKAVGRLPLEAVMHIGWQIIRGMGAGQGVGLVHRDLKPDNIFLLAENHVKVLDFGLATLLDRAMPPAEGAPEMRPPLSEVGGALSEGVSDSDDTVFDPLDSISPTEEISEGARARLTRPGTPVGTPRYMSPEQVLGWSVDHRSDLYSFGCILYEMLAGRSAYDGPNSRAYMHQHLHVPPRPLEDVAEGVPAPLVKIVHQLLAKSPSERYPDWSAVAEVLRQVRPQRRRTRITDREITQDLILPEAPYRFLDSFTKASRGIFFGRDQDAERFIRTWLHPDQPPIVILTGASGVGKTSFLCARVMPGLEDIDTRVIRIIGGDDPIRQLRAAIARELAQRSELNSLPELSEMTPMQALDTLVAHEGRPVAIILDQLEEIFTTGGRAEAAELQATLAAMIAGGTGGARFILSLREDYLGTLLRTLHPLPIDVVTRTIPLRPLEADDLKAALEGPSKRGLPVAYRPFLFEEGLVEEIISDLLADPAGEVAPRVQAVGARLWEMVRESPEPIITRAHYRERLGGAHGILARVLDEAIADLPLGDQGVTKELLRALTHLPGSPTSRPAPESELTAHADWERRQQILRRLEDRWRVVQGFTDPRWPEERTYRITHEALVARIQQYGEDGTGRNRARQLFHQGLSLWLQGGRQDSDLLPERHFDEVQRHIEELVLRTQSELAFYEACLTIHNEGWMRRHLEARRARSRSRMLFTLLPGLFILLGVTLGQAPVGFITLQTLRVRLAIALSLPAPDLSDAPLRGANLAGNA
ncbi:MAG: serine/threonine-protein kinase, partial [Myxococcota bacterium]